MMKRCMSAFAVLCLGLAVVVNAEEPAAKGEAAAKAPAVAPAGAANLQAAYAHEMGAKAQYEAFATKADEEGYKSLASLFRGFAQSAALRSEKRVAMLKTMGVEAEADVAKPDVKSTKENLDATLKAMTTEKDTVYPAFAARAATDKNDEAAMTFKGAIAVAGANIKICRQVAGELDAWKAPGKTVLVCLVCTYVSIDPKLEKCPVCDSPRSKFDAIK